MEDCPICYDSLNASTGHCTLACKHSYHIACLTKWCNQETTCPMCRRALSETEVVARPRSYMTFVEGNRDAGFFAEFLERLIVDPPPPAGAPPNANRILHIGGGVEVSEGDVVLVMEQANATRGAAVRALRRHDGDIVNSIMMLADEREADHTQTRAPRDPLVDPTDDQSTSWFLQRMFTEAPPQCSYPWNSFEDLRLRMNLLIDNHHECWKHADFNSIEPRDDGYETA